MKIRSHTPRRAFTLLELLMAILVIGLLMGLLIGGAVFVRRAAKAASDTATLTAITTGLTQFQQEFGFPPPLVRDQALPGPEAVIPAGGQGNARVAVYQVSVLADQAALRTSTLVPTTGNPLLDNRFSEMSLAVYLAGGLEYPVNTTGGAPPIDGFAGPGLYKPNKDGTFNIPKDVALGNAAYSKRIGNVYESFVSLGKSAPVLFRDPVVNEQAFLRDGRGTNIRYYRWLTGREEPAGSGRFVVETAADLNVPALVARDQSLPQFALLKQRPDRDLSANSRVRSAAWAVVVAGPNRFFGDESDLAAMAAALGKPVPASPGDEVALRALAEEDNLVEVGQ